MKECFGSGSDIATALLRALACTWRWRWVTTSHMETSLLRLLPGLLIGSRCPCPRITVRKLQRLARVGLVVLLGHVTASSTAHWAAPRLRMTPSRKRAWAQLSLTMRASYVRLF